MIIIRLIQYILHLAILVKDLHPLCSISLEGHGDDFALCIKLPEIVLSRVDGSNHCQIIPGSNQYNQCRQFSGDLIHRSQFELLSDRTRIQPIQLMQVVFRGSDIDSLNHCHIVPKSNQYIELGNIWSNFFDGKHLVAASLEMFYGSFNSLDSASNRTSTLGLNFLVILKLVLKCSTDLITHQKVNQTELGSEFIIIHHDNYSTRSSMIRSQHKSATLNTQTILRNYWRPLGGPIF